MKHVERQMKHAERQMKRDFGAHSMLLGDRLHGIQGHFGISSPP